MPRYNYRVRLVGGPLDKAEYETGTVFDEVTFPSAWFEDMGDMVGLRSASGRIVKDFRQEYPKWIDVNFAVYRKQDGQDSPDMWRFVYSHSFVVYRCSEITKKGRRCMNYTDEPDGKCRQHARMIDKQAGAAG